MKKSSNGFTSILIPGLTVFISSACIMIIELVASRLIARHLGSSLYTWTAVIGIVLAGITIGNYFGGRIADKYMARKALSTIFILSSISCVIIIVLNNIVGEWIWLWTLSWPVRVFSHVGLVFFGPSLLLGTISPVVAKMAIDRGFSTGRTVGDIYACGAAGSIMGTFLAGFFLIPAMGTIAIIWTVGGVLLLMGIVYWVRLWPAYVWLIAFFCALFLGTSSSSEGAQKIGESILLREKKDNSILYEDETPYCYVAVRQISQNPDKREFIQDKLRHSEIIINDVNNLQYFYTKVFDGITKILHPKGESLSAMIIGGGGYAFPQYLEKNWPGSKIDVIEIDPGVTKAARTSFGLSQKTSINTHSLDARNYVDDLLRKTNDNANLYDCIYEDAINDYSVPFQLVTNEFNKKIYNILKDDGIYLVNLIEIYEKGEFLGAMINTLEKTFPYIYVLSEGDSPKNMRNTFIIIASKIQLNTETLKKWYETRGIEVWFLSDYDIQKLINQRKQIVLTDNYAPVENLLAPVVLDGSKGLLTKRFREEAEQFAKEGKYTEAIGKYKKMLDISSTSTIEAYNEIAILFAQQGNFDEAVDYLKQALTYNETSDFKDNMGNIYFSLAVAQQKLGVNNEATNNFKNSITEYKKQLIKTPNSLKILSQTGDALASIGNFNEAIPYFEKVVNLNPSIVENHFKLAQAFEFANQFDEAIQSAQNSHNYFYKQGQFRIAELFTKYIDTVNSKKSKNN
ncbi:MAG: hypothetical protein A2Y12_09525 [Planctomycetes bacterium GWF2_42_9]|nr:MAG: hypothetical protein A2Y12_09525 [Planctomycetes bacterium GWF2_42_9]